MWADVFAIAGLLSLASGTLRVAIAIRTRPKAPTASNPTASQPTKHVATHQPETTSANATVDLRTVRFNQRFGCSRFSGSSGHTISSAADDLRSGLDPSHLPTIRFFARNGNLFSLDNRRSAAVQDAGVPMPYRMATSHETAKEA